MVHVCFGSNIQQLLFAFPASAFNTFHLLNLPTHAFRSSHVAWNDQWDLTVGYTEALQQTSNN